MNARLVTLLSAIAALAMLGCHHDAPRQCRQSPPIRGNLVFNAVDTGYPEADTSRYQWPAAVSDSPLWDQTDFATVLYDTQNQPLDGADWYYRRFQSIRTGRTVR